MVTNMEQKLLRIDSRDNAAVALTDLAAGETVATVPEAVARAKALAAPADTIFIGGSTFVVAEVL